MWEAFGPEIWIVDGPVVTAAAGFHYPTRMTVIRLAGGDLVIWSPVALTPQLRGEVEMLGNVRYLVAPNSLHDSFIADWHRAFPVAQVLAAPGVREKRADLKFGADLGNTPVPGWTGEIEVVLVRGNRITTEAVAFHRPSGTVIFTDLLQQFPPGWFKGWRALVARLDLMLADEPSVPRKFRVALSDKRVARAALRRIVAWRANKVLMAHGTPVRREGHAFLKRAFAWLVKW
ncbi:hypothetical protein VW23_012220 [Devosia insulae DS-56]|uniref:DUF4336 domain-containing protein n=2 Tax=Devosia insulae TaxID=408174 RepID=A0A1E5XUP7_9HYPH|nr:DUF4336 domain-containing protein [Devosia insulae]OEO32305.1 hypothetical protein VW23_012220 [Devosia insulae DS-56]